MQVLVGDTRSHKNVQRLKTLRWGRMFQEAKVTPFADEPWGFDNCAFLYWRRGVSFDSDAYRRRLDSAYRVGCPYMAVVPDIVAGGRASLEFSWQWFGVYAPEKATCKWCIADYKKRKDAQEN